MLATELDNESVDCARRNVARNDLEEFITGLREHNFNLMLNNLQLKVVVVKFFS